MKKVALIVAGLGMMILFSSGKVSAQVIAVTGSGSSEFGFDPGNLIDAVTGAGVDEHSGKCFICVNTSLGAGGTTAGALTNSMFGEIRKNSEADLGEDSSRPEDQDPSIPRKSGSCGTSCNDSGAFTFSMPLPDLDFLSEGTTTIANPNPDLGAGVVVGNAGVKMSFSNTFEYFDDGSSTFEQTVSQTTATGGFDGNEVQVVEFSANSSNGPISTLGGNKSGGLIFWSQSIEEGGFRLGTLDDPLTGSFAYDVGNFDKASAPTGQGQSTGATGQEIGTN